MPTYGKEFQQQYKIHQENKDAALDILKQHGVHVNTEWDIGEISHSSAKFYIRKECGHSLLARLVTDGRIANTGKVLLELGHKRYKTSNREDEPTLEPGWFMEQDTDVLLVYDFRADILYGFDLNMLRSLVSTDNPKFVQNSIDPNCDTAKVLKSIEWCKKNNAFFFQWGRRKAAPSAEMERIDVDDEELREATQEARRAIEELRRMKNDCTHSG